MIGASTFRSVQFTDLRPELNSGSVIREASSSSYSYVHQKKKKKKQKQKRVDVDDDHSDDHLLLTLKKNVLPSAHVKAASRSPGNPSQSGEILLGYPSARPLVSTL